MGGYMKAHTTTFGKPTKAVDENAPEFSKGGYSKKKATKK
jgi:hypothetical protein